MKNRHITRKRTYQKLEKMKSECLPYRKKYNEKINVESKDI